MNHKPVAIITGASRGIGRAVAISLASEGFDIAAIARTVDSEGMEILSHEVEKRKMEFFPVGLDISCTDCQKEVVSNILERYGRIDFLVNNAGVAPLQRDDLLDMSEESYERVLNINLKGPVFFAQKIAKDLRGKYRVFYDESGSIGRRYRRMDEIGTPYCITVDNETLSNGTVTLRYRDSMLQNRIDKSKLFSIEKF